MQGPVKVRDLAIVSKNVKYSNVALIFCAVLWEAITEHRRPKGLTYFDNSQKMWNAWQKLVFNIPWIELDFSTLSV